MAIAGADIQTSFEGSALARWVENIVTGFHDLGAALGAINPRPLSAIEQIQARINVLTNGINMSRKVSISDQKELNELQASMVRLKELEAQQTQFLAGEEAKRRTAAKAGPGGVTTALSTQMDTERAEAQRRYTVGQQVGLEAIDLQRIKLGELTKARDAHMEALATDTAMSAADRQARSGRRRRAPHRDRGPGSVHHGAQRRRPGASRGAASAESGSQRARSATPNRSSNASSNSSTK